MSRHKVFSNTPLIEKPLWYVCHGVVQLLKQRLTCRISRKSCGKKESIAVLQSMPVRIVSDLSQAGHRAC